MGHLGAQWQACGHMSRSGQIRSHGIAAARRPVVCLRSVRQGRGCSHQAVHPVRAAEVRRGDDHDPRHAGRERHPAGRAFPAAIVPSDRTESSPSGDVSVRSMPESCFFSDSSVLSPVRKYHTRQAVPSRNRTIGKTMRRAFMARQLRGFSYEILSW